MLVFIDESGCAGFKLERGSTPYFVASMVVFQDLEEANRVDQAIDALRNDIGQKAEFKFSKCRDEVRDGFFRCVSQFQFTARAIVVDKARLYSPHLRSDRRPFYNYFVQLLMKHDGHLISDAIVKIDGSGDREFKQELGAYLRTQLGARKIRKIKFERSNGSNLVQLADMVAGAIHRKYREDRADRSRWYDMLEPRIGDIWRFPNPGH